MNRVNDADVCTDEEVDISSLIITFSSSMRSNIRLMAPKIGYSPCLCRRIFMGTYPVDDNILIIFLTWKISINPPACPPTILCFVYG